MAASFFPRVVVVLHAAACGCGVGSTTSVKLHVGSCWIIACGSMRIRCGCLAACACRIPKLWKAGGGRASPPPPPHPQATSLVTCMGGRTVSVCKADLRLFIRIDETASDIIMLPWAAHTLLDKTLEGSLQHMAILAMRLAHHLKRMAVLLGQCPGALEVAPLVFPISFLRSWASGVTESQTVLVEFVIESGKDAMGLQTKLAEESCPRWGLAIPGGAVNLEMLKVMMDQIKLRLLPGALNLLWKRISELSAVASTTGLPGLTDNPATRDSAHVALNALSFGKSTVQVAAAVNALGGSAEDRKLVLAKAADLPTSLAEELRRKDEEASATASSSATHMQKSAQKRKTSAAKSMAKREGSGEGPLPRASKQRRGNPRVT